jgi:hypothetical protein
LAEAADRDECELLVEDEMEYQRLRGYIRVTAEAVELCEQCEGERQHPVEDCIVSICDACGGAHRNTFHLQARLRRRDDVHAIPSARSFRSWPASGAIPSLPVEGAYKRGLTKVLLA